jgi:hypothetical protein
MYSQKLNLPKVVLKTKLVEGTIQVFDVVRKNYFKLTAEEWVRQHFIHYLNSDKNYPFGLMGIEKMIKYNSLKKRADIVIYNNDGEPNILVECKAPNIKITQDAFDQVARYNFKLRVKYLVVTNGMKHFCCSIDYEKDEFNFLKEIPSFSYS